jgi:hypothetical protein
VLGLSSVSEEFGAKVSLPGFNVETAADSDLYFSSGWPIIKIDEDLSESIVLDPDNNLITHNLGYPPFTLVFSQNNGFLGAANNINSTTVIPVDSGYQSANIGDVLHVYVCRNPLNQNFLAKSIQLAQTQQGTNHEDYGIKFSKPGYDVSSTDLRNFTLHSGTKSLQVHQVLYQALGQFNDINYGLPNFPNAMGIKYITDLPYDPVYFAFFSSDNENFTPLFAISQTVPKIEFNTIDGGIIVYNQTNPGWGVFFILLDPYQSTNQVSVTL